MSIAAPVFGGCLSARGSTTELVESRSQVNAQPLMLEFNFDGIVGPTHNYAGLSYGNVASTAHYNSPSSPRAAALEGLAKIRRVAEMGIPQALLPPQCRPDLRTLNEMGFRGSAADLVAAAYRSNPALLAAVYSASSMWTANAATVSPSPDCEDGLVHISPANLASLLHRALEAAQTTKILRAVFRDPRHFKVHDPLDGGSTLADEGAANHTRLTVEFERPGIELFCFGRVALDPRKSFPQKFPARQTFEASASLARRHRLNEQSVFFLQQNPRAIDAGVFHNDVISVGNRNVLLVHELAYLDQPARLSEIARLFEDLFSSKIHVIVFSEKQLPLADAVSSYFFNSQLLVRPDNGMTLLCPSECETNANARRCLDELLALETPIDDVQFVNLRQSMNNGGGPACLRLRVCLNASQAAAIHQGILWTDELDQQLRQWVDKHYRELLTPDDLRDPKLIDQSFLAQEQLADILNLDRNLLLGESSPGIASGQYNVP